MFKKYLTNLYKSAEIQKEKVLKQVLNALPKNGLLLDVGCWDGEKTLWWGKALKSKKIIGLDSVKSACKIAQSKGIEAYHTDLDKEKWPIKDNFVDCLVSNLVIEHLSNVDHYISESYRVLKKGGYAVVSTNNLSSWHNIFSLFFGWAPFDLTNSSPKVWSIGNPLVVHGNEKSVYGPTFLHKCVYTIRWLKEWYGLYNFKLEDVKGAGYYPLPNFIGNIDKTHASLIILVFKKN